MARMWSREDKGISQGHTASEHGSRPEPFLSAQSPDLHHKLPSPAIGDGLFPICCPAAWPQKLFQRGLLPTKSFI